MRWTPAQICMLDCVSGRIIQSAYSVALALALVGTFWVRELTASLAQWFVEKNMAMSGRVEHQASSALWSVHKLPSKPSYPCCPLSSAPVKRTSGSARIRVLFGLGRPR